MKKSLGLLAVPLIVFATSGRGQQDAFLGVWDPGAPYNRAAFPYLRITSASVQFSSDRANWTCETPYKIVSSGEGDAYINRFTQEDLDMTPGATKFWELEFRNAECTGSTHFLIAMFDFSNDYVEIMR